MPYSPVAPPLESTSIRVGQGGNQGKGGTVGYGEATSGAEWGGVRGVDDGRASWGNRAGKSHVAESIRSGRRESANRRYIIIRSLGFWRLNELSPPGHPLDFDLETCDSLPHRLAFLPRTRWPGDGKRGGHNVVKTHVSYAFDLAWSC